MKSLIVIAAMIPCVAFAQTSPQKYIDVCKTPCNVTTIGADGNSVTTQEPAGYVYAIIEWDGVTPYDPGTGFELQPDTSGSVAVGQIVTP